MTQRVAQRRSRAFGVARPAATLLTAFLVMFGATRAPTAARGADAVAIANQRQAIPTPHLLIEGWLDRNHVSDLYAFDLAGKLIRRLTSEPLPTCKLAAVAPGGTNIFFVANASTLYGLSPRLDVLSSVHSSNARAVAVSPRGDVIAFVITPDAPFGTTATPADAGVRPLALRVMPVASGSSWHPTQFLLPAGVAPSEMTFAPDGRHVLITNGDRDRKAQLVLVDLTTGEIGPVLTDARVSYSEPVFAPDGKSLLAVREDFVAGRWSIVSVPWPATNVGGGGVRTARGDAGAREPTAVLTGPRGIVLSTPIFVADGKHFLFNHGDALARATLDGQVVESLSGHLDQNDHAWGGGLVIDGSLPVRPGWLPTVTTRYFARVERREQKDPAAPPNADVIIIDLLTKERRVVPMPAGVIPAAVVVE